MTEMMATMYAGGGWIGATFTILILILLLLAAAALAKYLFTGHGKPTP